MRFPLLEPGSEPTTAGYPTDFQVALSQAISLKRIADSIDRLASADKQAALTAQNLVEQLRLSAEAQSRERTAAVEAARTGDNPWIEWPGGECPVPDEVMVDMRLANGAEFIGRQAGLLSWRHLKNSLSESNIVAWRLHK